MATYFETEIKKHIKGIQTFNADKEGSWVQYDIKSLSAKELTKVYNYFKNSYKEVYPRIQRMGNEFIGDIQIKIN